MVRILGRRFPTLQILTLADFPGAPEPEETGTTYPENARIKAEAARDLTGEWCVADDAGLEIDHLGGAPGLYSKRFEGVGSSFAHKITRILELLEGAPSRAARFRCAVALARPGEPTEDFIAVCEGSIAEAPSGGGGFGYDPVFLLPDGRTMAEITADEKDEISHRGAVLRALGDRLADLTRTRLSPHP